MRKKVILIAIIIILGVLDVYLFSTYIYGKYRNKTALETETVNLAEEISSSPFSISKILLYSSAYGENKNTNFQSSDWILDIFQYTDIAIYLETDETIKDLWISNPNLGENQSLYYLDSSEYGTPSILTDYEITDTLEYTVLNYDNSDNSIGYNTPVFFADCSNPITLKYVNMISTNYSIPNTEKLAFDGSLLLQTTTKLKNLEANISFDVNIKDYNNNTYSATVYIDIPIESDTASILDGYIYEVEEGESTIFWKE